MNKRERLLKLLEIYEATTYSQSEQEAAKIFLNRLRQADAKTLMAVGFAVLDTLAKNIKEQRNV